MKDVGITYGPRHDATSQGERTQLAAVYRFVLDCHAKKKDGRDHGSQGVDINAEVAAADKKKAVIS